MHFVRARAHVRALMTQKSCAVGMRNAKLGNHLKGWFTLATESEAQGALRSSVNQKSESEAESEARRNRSQKDQKSFFFFDSASASVASDLVRTG